MPMKLNVGTSQKVSDNHYGSRGASVNLELELDSSLVSEPERLRDKIRHLFALVRESVAEELKGAHSSPDHVTPSLAAAARAAVCANGGPKHGVRPATASQVKALYAITRHMGLDLGELVQERCGLQRASELDIRQASDLIDSLKSSTPQPTA